MSATAIQILRLVLVLALLIVAAALATPPGRIPIALRGVYRILRRDGVQGARTALAGEAVVPGWKRLLAFVLVILALGLALT